MPTTSDDLKASRTEAMMRKAKARIAQFHDPAAPEWATDPGIAMDELTTMLADIEFAPVYPSLWEFVDDFICQGNARVVIHTPQATWCPEWAKHQEARRILGLLWECYEYVHATGGPLEMSEFELRHLGPHLQNLWNPDGVFKHCSVLKGHSDMLERMPNKVTATDLAATDPTMAIVA